MEYHIRYTCSGDLQALVVNFIMKNANKYIISREIASREHIQCYVVTNVVKKTWVNKFNLKFKDLDRRDKYVELDKGKTKLYVCKGNSISEEPDVIAKLGFTDEEIKAYHSEYWQQHIPPEIQEIPMLLPETKDKKEKKAKPVGFLIRLYHRLQDKYPTMDWSEQHYPLIYKEYMFACGNAVKPISKFIIQNNVTGLLNALLHRKHEWLAKLFEEAFPHMNYPSESYLKKQGFTDDYALDKETNHSPDPDE